MKNWNQIVLAVALGLPLSTLTLAAAAPRLPKKPSGPIAPATPPSAPPLPAWIVALDTDHNGSLSVAEVQQAPAALLTLDKNGDGQLQREEWHGPRPQSPGGQPPQKDNENHPRHPAHPPLPFLEALDADQDGILSAEEIAAATQSLAALDANDDDQLTLDELLPAPPQKNGQRPGRPADGPRPGPGQAPRR